MKHRIIDLFSGIGGFSLAAHSLGMTTIAFCDIEPFAQRILARHFPGVPIFDDVKELTADALADASPIRGPQECGAAACRGQDDGQHRPSGESRSDGLVLTAGFPCQDISYAGKGAGLAGERSGLFYEVARLVGELRPDYVLLENVAGLLTRGLDAVLGTLAESGYDSTWSCVPACAVGAPHRRDRVWIVAVPEHPDNERRLRAIHAHVLSHLTPFGDDRWSTPIANEAEKRGNHDEGLRGEVVRNGDRWPTPTQQDGENNGGPSQYERNSLALNTLVKVDTPAGALNPAWVETLLGYPIGYTLTDGEPQAWLPTRWPAGLGAPQHDWEPPRLTTEKRDRAARLKALGNSIVPQCARLWLEAIQEDIR